MRTFTSQSSITAVKRLGAYTGGKATRGTTAVSYTGYLRPLSEEQAAQNGLQWGIGYTLITETGVDIQVGDILTIAGTDYTVRGKADHSRGGYGTAYLKFLVVLPQA